MNVNDLCRGSEINWFYTDMAAVIVYVEDFFDDLNWFFLCQSVRLQSSPIAPRSTCFLKLLFYSSSQFQVWAVVVRPPAWRPRRACTPCPVDVAMCPRPTRAALAPAKAAAQHRCFTCRRPRLQAAAASVPCAITVSKIRVLIAAVLPGKRLPKRPVPSSGQSQQLLVLTAAIAPLRPLSVPRLITTRWVRTRRHRTHWSRLQPQHPQPLPPNLLSPVNLRPR